MTRRMPAAVLPAAAALAVAAGLLLRYGLADAAGAHAVWRVSLFVTAAPLLWRLAGSIRRGQFATDIVASLAIIGAILLDEPLAGLVVVLMQSGGESLEDWAAGRASRAVRALEDAAPRIAHRLTDSGVEDVPVDAVAAGDRLLVRPGDMIPCDATVLDGESHVDTSSLSQEQLLLRTIVTRDQAGRNDQQAACGAEQMMTVEVFAGLGDEDIAERQGDQGDRTGHETGGDAKMPGECGTE